MTFGKMLAFTNIPEISHKIYLSKENPYSELGF